MREKKYRAWHKRERKWYEPSHIGVNGYRAVMSIYTGSTWFTEGFYPDDFELVEYTGLKDKHGKEIYEGNILQTDRGLFEVFWRDDFAGFYVCKLDEPGWIDLISMTGNVTWCEIIGNIYEQTELLQHEAK